MSKSIDDFIVSLPEMSQEEANDRYMDTEAEEFLRIELNGAYELSKVGIQMVYAVARGKIIYGSKEKDALFYARCLTTHDFFKRSSQVEAIPLERIIGVKIMQFSSEEYEHLIETPVKS